MPNARKLAQLAAYFLHRAGGGPMDHYKLMKLMYLADREALDAYGFPIGDDEYRSMKKGSVLSTALNLFYGKGAEKAQKEWNEWVSTKQGRQLRPPKKIADGDLDWLADEEIAAADRVFKKFGNQTWQELIEYAHSLEEWTDPGETTPSDTKSPLSPRNILEALKKPADEIAATVRYLTEIEPNIKAAPLSGLNFN